MVHRNGTVYCTCNRIPRPLFRTDDIDSGVWTHVTDLVFPASWSNAYCHVEDPYLYMDARGNFHLLTHSYDFRDGWPANPNQTQPNLVSNHGYSSDGLSWTFDDEPPYFATITFGDGSRQNFSTLERPHLVFDAAGEPTHLVNGASPFWLGPDGHPCSLCGATSGSAHSCVVCKTTLGIDWTYTLVQPLTPPK